MHSYNIPFWCYNITFTSSWTWNWIAKHEMYNGNEPSLKFRRRKRLFHIHCIRKSRPLPIHCSWNEDSLCSLNSLVFDVFVYLEPNHIETQYTNRCLLLMLAENQMKIYFISFRLFGCIEHVLHSYFVWMAPISRPHTSAHFRFRLQESREQRNFE